MIREGWLISASNQQLSRAANSAHLPVAMYTTDLHGLLRLCPIWVAKLTRLEAKLGHSSLCHRLHNGICLTFVQSDVYRNSRILEGSPWPLQRTVEGR